MKVAKLLSLGCLAALAGLGLARADWTVSGTFTYVDREYDQDGFTGLEPLLPVRHATVEVWDPDARGKKALLAAGATDENGNFSFLVPDSKVRTVYVRVLTTSETVADLHLQVENIGNPRGPYAVASPEFAGHEPTADLDIGTVSAAIGLGGEAFNIYDMGVRAIDFIAALNGARPGSSDELTFEWDAVLSPAGFSSYDPGSKTIHLARVSAYNDTVILHESGHYAYHLYSASNNPGGVHHLTDCDQDIRLAYDEGRATWFGQSTLRHHTLPNPHLYVKTTGAPGPGNLDFYFDVEAEAPYYCDGAASEVAVYAALWDINDTAATEDGVPGDDDLLALASTENWDVDTGYLPSAADKSLEDFWDGWFSLGKGNQAGMIATFQNTSIEFYPDAAEPNDAVQTALPVSPTGGVTHQTYFADPDGDGVGEDDPDYFSFAASAGTAYTVETLNLWGDANTWLDLLDSDGSTILASNDDRGAGDSSSQVTYTPSASGTLYVRSQHAPDLGIYGSYDLKVSGSPPLDSDEDGYFSDVDCDDSDPNVHPGAVETCNGVDDNCVDGIDEGFDLDGDTYTTCAGDCNDGDPGIHPGAAELCNGVDDNCVDGVDEGYDQDTDTYRTCDGDCDDSDPNVHPGATEICNGVDDNCAGGVDEGFDADEDGYTTCGGDCNDSAPAMNPGAAEDCVNGIDDDCDQLTDGQDPQCQVDTITITEAEWHSKAKRLTVWATSSAAPSATLTLEGFGVMTYDGGNNRYGFQDKVPLNPETVTVTSSEGGSGTSAVNVK